MEGGNNFLQEGGRESGRGGERADGRREGRGGGREGWGRERLCEYPKIDLNRKVSQLVS